MTDSSGAQIGQTMKYLHFGETLTGNVPTDKKFTGQRLDATGLYYYGARYYDATIGRFISPDTVIQSPANPQNRNRYSYSLNNPLRFIDPTGHIVEINGWNIKTIDSLKGCPYLPPEVSNAVADIVASPEYQAYNEFKSMSPMNELMAKSMEENTEHKVTITSGQTRIWWADMKRNGNDFTITFKPESFLPILGIPLSEQANTICDIVHRQILDTTDFSFWNALWDSTIGLAIDKITGAGPIMDVADIYYQIKIGNSPVIVIGDKIFSYIPFYDFFKSLFSQNDEYYQFLIDNNLYYEFRDE